ncbi:MAG: putative protein serine/threonine kinase [Streblomastix strix]|uniref:Protein kinase domain-containing protein n=1 Tax=Streblomastix strix TaxID=222440 RepID=A0A5J4W0G9_9EUKA|nr:MAG: putative protein serine/threonine kinase [Streblomastix strix]
MTELKLNIEIGDVVKDRYKIIQKISSGDNHAIFCTLDLQMQQIVIKFEKYFEEQTAVCIESAILKILANQIHIPKFYQYGSHLKYKFMAYELLGPNMIDLVNYKKPYKFSLHSMLKFGIQAIETLQIVHNKGFIHRNIKPGYFLIGNTQGTSGTFYLTNFGLCKKLNKIDNIVVKPINKSTFRGTTMYASLNAHNLIELGRQDDLISLLYILVEFYNGMLPWSDDDEIRRSSIVDQSFIRPRMGTIQEFVDVLDSLTGVKSDANFNPFEVSEDEDKPPLFRKDSFIEQFMDSMKNQEERQRDLDWALFVEQANQNHLQEGNDENKDGETDKQNNDSNENYQYFLNIYSPPIPENSQTSPTEQLQQQHRYSSPKTAVIERILSPEQLVSELLPIDEVIHNQPGPSRTHNTLIANMKHNKQPQLLLLKSKQYLDPMPVTPIGDDMKEELKEWNMHEDSYINPKYCRNKQISKQYDKQEDSYRSLTKFNKYTHQNKTKK